MDRSAPQQLFREGLAVVAGRSRQGPIIVDGEDGDRSPVREQLVTEEPDVGRTNLCGCCGTIQHPALEIESSTYAANETAEDLGIRVAS
jgi:hypothetical protein